MKREKRVWMSGARRTRALVVNLALALGLAPGLALAVQPDVKTVPWVASNPLIPHDTWSGKQITLKGTADVQGANFEYTWDFGDGSPVAVGTVTNQYAIAATHTYTGNVGDIFTARLTVEDTSTGETDSATYFVAIEPQELSTEVNVAIDEGLWRLHTTMARTTVAGTSGTEDAGHWESGCSFNCTSWDSITPTNVQAFEVNGHLESGSPDNPYTETVARGMRWLFTKLTTSAVSDQTYDLPIGVVDPDSNGNGYGVRTTETDDMYQGGPFIDAIVASGTPAAVTTTGNLPSGSNPGIRGRTYEDIVQDLVDWYAYGQGDRGTNFGGWDYGSQNNTTNSRTDNSINQWAAIGMIAAERDFGATVPQFVKDANANSIARTQTTSGASAGQFGYSSTSPIWGPYAVTPSGMVQLAMDGVGRGANPWDLGETYLRDRFCNTGSAGSAMRSYYYGMFSFTKSMLLHDSNADGVAEPITFLQSMTAGMSPIDWYAAQASAGDDCDGVARTLVSTQNAAGYWYGHNFTSTQYPYETGWAIIMLNRTVFASGLPVAVAQAFPNPGVVGQIITLDGSASFHQDPSKSIDSWAWDLDNDGNFDDAFGPMVSTSFPAVADYPVGLRVTDDATPEASDDTIVTVRITTPPIAPTANADGPYVFCPQAQPWFLDGTGSVNPDEGQSEPGLPGDTIQQYAWELDGLDGDFDEAFGPQPDVTAFFQALGVGDYLIQLKVTDTTATSFPSSGLGDLSDTDSAQVSVKAATDPACACIDDLVARPKDGKIQLNWTDFGAASTNVYRSTTAGGPYTFVGNTVYAVFVDTGLINGTTYYYVARPAALNGDDLCQSNEANATPLARVRRR